MIVAIEKSLIVIALVLSICLVKVVTVKSLSTWFHMSMYGQKIVWFSLLRVFGWSFVNFPTMLISQYLPQNIVSEVWRSKPLHLSSWQRKIMMIEKGVGAMIKCGFHVRSKTESWKLQTLIEALCLFWRFIGLDDLRRFLRYDDALKTLDIFRMTYEDNENIRINLLYSSNSCEFGRLRTIFEFYELYLHFLFMFYFQIIYMMSVTYFVYGIRFVIFFLLVLFL